MLRMQHYGRNKVIVEQGAIIAKPILISSGIVAFERRLQASKTVIVGFYGGGEHIGLSAALTRSQLQYSAISITEVATVSNAVPDPKSTMLELYMKMLDSRAVYTETTTPGIIRFLKFAISYARRFGVYKHRAVFRVVGFPSHQQIANALNIQRVTVSRYISESRKARVLDGKRYEVVIDVRRAYRYMDDIILERL